MTCIVLAYIIFKMKLFMPQLRFSNGNFRIGDSIPNNQLVNYVHTCQRLAIIGVTRNTLNDCTCIVLQHIHFEVAWYVISELCLRSANCLLNMFHQIQEFFFSSIIMKVAGMRSRCGQLLFFLPPPSTHNKLPYHYGNVYISMPFLRIQRFFTICRKHF